jgi:hypothetical protein
VARLQQRAQLLEHIVTDVGLLPGGTLPVGEAAASQATASAPSRTGAGGGAATGDGRKRRRFSAAILHAVPLTPALQHSIGAGLADAEQHAPQRATFGAAGLLWAAPSWHRKAAAEAVGDESRADDDEDNGAGDAAVRVAARLHQLAAAWPHRLERVKSALASSATAGAAGDGGRDQAAALDQPDAPALAVDRVGEPAAKRVRPNDDELAAIRRRSASAFALLAATEQLV